MSLLRPRVVFASLTPALGMLGLAALLACPEARAQSNYATPYAITTLAGKAGTDGGSVDGTGSAAFFNIPAGICSDSSGNIYVADYGNDTIRKVTPSGVVTTLAGSPAHSGSADGTGSAARFNNPEGVAVDTSGNVYVTDNGNNTVRKVTPAGVVTTFVGSATTSGSTDGTGNAALFAGPYGITIDSSNNLYVVDQINNTIRKVTTPGAVVTTFAGTAGVAGQTDGTGTAAHFKVPYGIRADSSGNIYVADTGNQTIRKITSAGVVTTIAGTVGHIGHVDGQGIAASFDNPLAVAPDANGNVYVADYSNNTIREISSSGAVTTFAGVPLVGGFVDGQGTSAEFFGPFDLVVDPSGNIDVSDEVNNTIRKITSGGAVTTLAGTPQGGSANGTGSAARFNRPSGVALDSSGNLYVADENNELIRKIAPGGVVTTLAGTAGNAGSANGTGAAAQFNEPFRVALDKNNNLFVSDYNNSVIREITPGGAVSVFAGTVGTAGSKDGTGTAAQFNGPLGIAFDSSGNLFVVEQVNNTVRKITPAGVVTTLAGTAGAVGSTDGTGAAAKFQLPAGDAVDSSGNIYVADYGNNTIRKVTQAGVVTTVSGTPGSGGNKDGPVNVATFFSPAGLTLDASGNIYVADSSNNEIREISAAGIVTTLAGSAPPATAPGATAPIPGSADGTGADAEFNQPFDVAVDSSGNLYIADSSNGTIRFGSQNAAPQITSQPTAQTTVTGGSATFSVTASGASLNYQWTFNGAVISGATGSSYTITNAQASNVGSYAVVLTNSNGSTQSSSVTLAVNAPGSNTARLINISTRAMVGTGSSILIPGFVVGGSGTETLLIRAGGPALSQFGVAGVLAQPILTVLSQSGATVATNQGWGTASNAAQIATVSAQVNAYSFATGSADCAVLVSLAPGSYTVQVSGVGGTTGVALAEVYEVSYSGTRLTNISTRAQVGTGANIVIPGFVISGSGNEELLVRAVGPDLANFAVTGVLATPTLTMFSQSGAIVATDTGWQNGPSASQVAAVTGTVTFTLPAGSADSATVVNIGAGAYTIQVSGTNNSTGVALAEIYEIQ